MSEFLLQFICTIIYIFTLNLYTGCNSSQPSVQTHVSSVISSLPAVQSAVTVQTDLKIEEVFLDPMIIVGHASVDTGSVLGIIADESEEMACKMSGGFLVVPMLPEASTYLNCGDQRDAIFVMKLVNCTGEKIVFSAFNFTLTVPSVQEQIAKVDLAGEFIQFELHVDNDHTSYLSSTKVVDQKTTVVSIEDASIEVEAGESQYCRLKTIRRCTDQGDRFEFNLDLTGVYASKGEEEIRVIGAVFNRSDRQVTFMSRD